MSSPLGGFYIGAYNRKKAAEVEQENRVKLTADIALYFDDKSVFEQQLSIEVGIQGLFGSDSAQIEVTSSISDSGLCCLELDVTGKGAFEDFGNIGAQQVNLAPGDSLTTQVCGNERVKVLIAEVKPVS
jgi:hypothetical protein